MPRRYGSSVHTSFGQDGNDMNIKSNRNTNNLKSIEGFCDQEFLSFFYAERERLQSNEDYPGWSIWAIVGSIGALLYFVYSTMKGMEGIVDWKLCYYIFSVFCPISLSSMMLYETRRSFKYGGTRHIQKLIDAAPKLMLGFYTILYTALVIGGILMKIETRIVGLWGFSLMTFLICLISVVCCRNEYVCAAEGFVFSHYKKLNRCLLFLFSSVVILPWVTAMSKLSFGFSNEFECSIAIVLVVILGYVLLRFFFVDNLSSRLDELIENYLHRGWNKHRVMKHYEEIVLGKRPFDLLESRFYALIDSMKESEAVEKKVQELKDKLEKNNQNDICLLNLPDELSKDIDFIKRFIETYDSFREGVDEMLSVKISILDDDFRTMLDTMVASRGELDASIDRLHSVQNMIGEINKTISQKLVKLSCTRDCPNRCLTK